MQSATSNFTHAMTGAGRIRADRLLIDWSLDGLARRVVYDDYDRTLPDQWGFTSSGHIWNLNGDGGTVASANWDVPGNGTGTMQVPTAPAYRMSLLPSELYGDNDFSVDFRCPAASGANLEVSQLAGGTTAQTYIEVRLTIVPSGEVIAQLVERLDGVETLLSQSTLPHTHDASTWYRYRLQRYGTDIRARVFPADTTEPFDRWDLQAQYEGELSIGFPGIKFGAATGNLNAKPVTCEWRNFELVNGQYDDMSKQLGAWSVDHHLDDGLPDQVSFVAGTAVPELRAEILRPGWIAGRGRMTNREFFSPFNPDSPIAGFERDVPPTRLDVGVVGTDGREYLPVFTGQAQDLIMRGGEVVLPAISATRLALSKLVQPPAVYGFYEGANATWVVSYALAACGVYASPPPQTGCRWWAPMHGSVRSFIPAANNPQINLALYASDGEGGNSSGGQNVIDAEWVDGPYVSAPYLSFTDDRQALIDIVPTGDGQALEDGDDVLSQAGNLAKFEFWVRGDPHTDALSPIRLFLTNTNGTSLECRIALVTRLPTIVVDDNTGTYTFAHSQALPTDGEWHFVGFAWRIGSPSKRWINLNGVVETDNTSFQISAFPATEDWENDNPRPIFRLPIAEVQLTTGATANPDNFPWLNEIDFTPGAQVVRSSVNLVSIAERTPREAWDIISSFALAELAMLRIDETDVVRYLGWRHWGKAAQQTVVDVLDSERNMAAPDVNIDPTKIRNAVSATFSEGFNINLFSSGLALSDVYELPPGISILVIPTDANIVEIRGYSFDYIESADTTQPTTTNFISLNLASDGSGAYGTAAHVTVEVIDWNPGEVTIQLDNTSGITWYTANNKSWATINVAGKLLDLKSRTITESDANSIAVRGERGLGPLSLTVLQRPVDARRTAQRLVRTLRKAVPTIERTSVRGDPRRQPGDLVNVVDRETGLDHRFRLQSVMHSDDGQLYTQQVTLRRAKSTGLWGSAIWGEDLWGETP